MTSVAIVITFRDEADTISQLLESVAAQTRPPDQVVLVDGGSTDSTMASAKTFAHANRDRLDVEVIGTQCNRAQGRNLGIRRSQAPIIAVTDAGCVLEKDWLENIVKPLEAGESDVVGGVCLPRTSGPLQASVGKVLIPDPKDIDPDRFLPSSRNIAFTRRAFELSGGYPEEFEFNEDTVFAHNLRRLGLRIKLVQEARVYWLPPSTLTGALATFYNYGRGDGQAGTFPDLYGRIGAKYGALAAAALTGLLSRGGLRRASLAMAAMILAAERPRLYRAVFSRRALDFWPLIPLKWTRDIALFSGWIRGLAERGEFGKTRERPE